MAYCIYDKSTAKQTGIYRILKDFTVEQRSYPEFPYVMILSHYEVTYIEPVLAEDVLPGLLFGNREDAFAVLLALSACGSEISDLEVLEVMG